jgi:hypothetical protein
MVPAGSDASRAVATASTYLVESEREKPIQTSLLAFAVILGKK